MAERLSGLFLFQERNMAWFGEKKQDGAAKTPEEIKAEQDAFVATLRTSFEETIKPLQEKVNSYEQRFSAIEEGVRKPATPREPTQTPSVLDDEDAAFTARVGPVALQTALLNARVTESEILSEVSAKGWGEFVPEIKSVLSKAPPQIKASDTYDQYVTNVVKMVVGAKAMEGGLKFSGDKKTFFIENGGGGTPVSTGMRQLEQEASDGRVDIGDPATFARKMGISLEALSKEVS
jgi:hypothetical protein